MEKEVLEYFLNLPLSSTDAVFEKFESITNARIYVGEQPKQKVLYIEGDRNDRILIVAHADTVWDEVYVNEQIQQYTYADEEEIYYGSLLQAGIGADDRAGCAIAWLMRESGHSILITDGEERGEIGATYLKEQEIDVYERINQHQYILQVDLRGKNGYKCYDLPVSNAFTDYIEQHTNLRNAGKEKRTDICVLCNQICGVNISVGYKREHSVLETLDYEAWLCAYQRVKALAELSKIPKFSLFEKM
ncbi:MAG TPA: hypothetical protein VN258_17860 [Mobilitalea sp.]|nr:hypothetical protein [Mobilitalea sp.]